MTLCSMELMIITQTHGQDNIQLSHVKVQQTAVFSALIPGSYTIIIITGMDMHVTTCKLPVQMMAVQYSAMVSGHVNV